MRKLAVVPLALVALLCGPAHAGPPLCPIDLKVEPGMFFIINSEQSCPQITFVGAPITAIAECFAQSGGMNCEAYPQEYASSGYLLYQWRVRVGAIETVYPVGSNPFISFGCAPRQIVTATVTVWNGSYASTDVVGYGCGNQTQ